MANETQTHLRVKATSFSQQTVRGALSPWPKTLRGPGEVGGFWPQGFSGWAGREVGILYVGQFRAGAGGKAPCAGAGGGEMGEHLDTLRL